jgi:hypothetical protein
MQAVHGVLTKRLLVVGDLTAKNLLQSIVARAMVHCSLQSARTHSTYDMGEVVYAGCCLQLQLLSGTGYQVGGGFSQFAFGIAQKPKPLKMFLIEILDNHVQRMRVAEIDCWLSQQSRGAVLRGELQQRQLLASNLLPAVLLPLPFRQRIKLAVTGCRGSTIGGSPA